MAAYNQAITEIIRQRFSCRNYDPRPVEPGLRDQLSKVLAASSTGPLGTRMRFELVSAGKDDSAAKLLIELNSFLKEINEDGTYQKVYKKYFH